MQDTSPGPQSVHNRRVPLYKRMHGKGDRAYVPRVWLGDLVGHLAGVVDGEPGHGGVFAELNEAASLTAFPSRGQQD